jgi:hypothetical protein
MPPKKAPRSHDGLAAKRIAPRPAFKSDGTLGRRPHPAAAALRAAVNPGSLTPRDVLQLQRTVGNRAAGEMLLRAARPGPVQKVDDRERRRDENRTGLPDTVRAGVESLSGLSLDDVRVHYNSSKPAAVNALAYTQGTDIYVARGQERHLAHEAWHAVQQKRGRVRPTLQAKGVSINDDKSLEREADVMGAKALRMNCCGPSAAAAVPQAPATVQRAQATTDSSGGPDAGRGVMQLASTVLHFGADLTGTSKITATNHTRGAVHKQAVDWVFDNGAWRSVPDGEVCNHSKAYNTAAQEILNAIHDKKLTKAAKIVTDTHQSLRDNDKGVGAPTSTHKSVMDDLIDDPTEDANVDNVVDAFNYYIYKICDYPANLFFWPEKTDGNPDQPYGEYGENNRPHKDWKVTNTLIGNKTRLNREVKRLKEGRDELNKALP